MRPAFFLLAASVVALASVSACKPTKCVDPEDQDGMAVDRQTLAKLQKAVDKDSAFCGELAAPKVALTGLDIAVTGPAGERKVAKRSDLSATETKPVDALSKRLKSYRELWKQLHPEQSFPGKVDIALDPALEVPRAIAVILTSGFAGFPFVHLTSGNAALDFEVFYPQSPAADRADGTDRVLVVEPAGAATSVVRLHDVVKCEDIGDKIPVPDDAVPGAIRTLCTGKTPCANSIAFRVRGTTNAGELAKSAKDILAAYPNEFAKPTLALTTNAAPFLRCRPKALLLP